MKTILLSLTFFISFLCAAQSDFKPTVQVYYDLGIDDNKTNTIGIDFIAGFKVTDLLVLGAGTGLGSSDMLYYKSYNKGDSYDSRETVMILPLYGHGKINFTKTGISPYLSLNAGYTLSLTSSYDHPGLMVKPSFGVDFPLNNGGSFFAQVAYKYQHFNYTYFSITETDTSDTLESGHAAQLEFAVGYTF
jgi:hypothetical protein